MAYISKENFIAFIDKKIEKSGLGYVIGSQLKGYINKQPTADVVEVVRCKDCMYHDDICKHPDGLFRTTDNSYCSFGKRKENK